MIGWEKFRHIGLVAALATWGFLVVSGSFVMLSYGSTPSVGADPPTQWPADTALQRTFGEPALVMFVNPRCDCTLASFEQLLRVLTSARIPVDCHLVFTLPGDTEPNWEEHSLRQRATPVAAIRVFHDYFATETRRFAVSASGHVLLYDSSGRLVFTGGITAAREDERDVAGTQVLIERLSGMQPSEFKAPVSGCPLLDEVDLCPSVTRPEDTE